MPAQGEDAHPRRMVPTSPGWLGATPPPGARGRRLPRTRFHGLWLIADGNTSISRDFGFGAQPMFKVLAMGTPVPLSQGISSLANGELSFGFHFTLRDPQLP